MYGRQLILVRHGCQAELIAISVVPSPLWADDFKLASE